MQTWLLQNRLAENIAGSESILGADTPQAKRSHGHLDELRLEFASSPHKLGANTDL